MKRNKLQQTLKRIKDLILDWTEPWREERASLDLEWRVFAKKHNAAGKRPEGWYPGMELDPMEKVTLWDEEETDPDCLIEAHKAAAALEKKVAEEAE